MALPDEIISSITRTDAALLLIDLQRRHMDVDGVGYHTLPPDRARYVTSNAGKAIELAREVGMPVVHVATWSKPRTPWGNPSGSNPFFAWQNGKPITGATFVRQADKCTEGSVYAEFMPETVPLPHEPVVVKFRYSGFYMTNLELVLRSLGIKTLFIAGVNSNNCVLHTSFDAHARDFVVIVLEDASGSMNGDQYHRMGISQISASLGWVSSTDEFADLMRSTAPREGMAGTASTS